MIMPEDTTPLVAEVRDKVVLDLKRQALACKKAENTTEALQFLKQSKQVAAATAIEEIPSPDLQCLYLKSLAGHLKASEDLEGAMNALKRAKQIQAAAANADNDDDDALHELEDDEPEIQETAIAGGVSFTDEEMMDEDMMTEFQMAGMEVPSQDSYQQRILVYKKKALALKKQSNVTGATSELRRAKLLEKVMAALMKNGATQQQASFVLDGGNPVDGWMDNLTPEESELLGELMQPKSSDSGNEDFTIDEGPATQSIEWQELETLEDSDIRDFMDMGIVELPSVPDLNTLAEDAQKKAVGFKQNGNIEMAKTKLLESKKIKLQAARLDRILKESSSACDDQQVSGDTVEDLEKLLLHGGESSTPKVVPIKEKQVNPWLLKPAAEVKTEVVRLKNAKKVSEASKMLLILKQVLKKENEAKEAARCQELIVKINLELDLCRRQLQVMPFYKNFCDATQGAEQLMLWKTYSEQCRKVMAIVESKGSMAIKWPLPKPAKLDSPHFDDAQEFVSKMIQKVTTPDSLNGRLEVSVLEVLSMNENKTILKLLKKRQKELVGAPKNNEAKELKDANLYKQIQVDVKVQLPPGIESANTESKSEVPAPLSSTCTLLPQGSGEPEEDSSTAAQETNQSLVFEDSARSFWLPRGESNKEKALLRRLERKKIEFHLVYNPNIVVKSSKTAEKASWFWNSSDKKPTKEALATTNLGKVVVELKDLLHRNCIAGDFPLVVNSKSVGGIVRLCVRTDAPIDPSQFVCDDEAL